jgi:hypothetical protein
MSLLKSARMVVRAQVSLQQIDLVPLDVFPAVTSKMAVPAVDGGSPFSAPFIAATLTVMVHTHNGILFSHKKMNLRTLYSVK